MALGKISETTSHVTGPYESAWKAMYAEMPSTTAMEAGVTLPGLLEESLI